LTQQDVSRTRVLLVDGQTVYSPGEVRHYIGQVNISCSQTQADISFDVGGILYKQIGSFVRLVFDGSKHWKTIILLNNTTVATILIGISLSTSLTVHTTKNGQKLYVWSGRYALCRNSSAVARLLV